MKLFKNLSENYGRNTAIIDDNGDSVTYNNLDSLFNASINKINTRSLVFCLCENSIESVVGYYNFIKINVVPLLLDISLNNDLLKDLLEIYSPEYIWMPKQKNINNLSKTEVFKFKNYVLFKLNDTKKYKLHNDLALLLTTSGSTGSPKLVKLTYDNLMYNALSIKKYLNIDEDEKAITILPMHYSFGLSVINSHFLSGATILLTNKSCMESKFWVFLNLQKPSSISGVPYTLEILKKLKFLNKDWPFIKTITQAGGKLNNGLNEEFSKYCVKYNKRFYVMYGQTEATARMGYLPYKFSLSKIGSMGIAIPGGEFDLIDEKGAILKKHNVTGELIYRGRNVSMGYAKNGADLIKGDKNNGLLYTGDYAKRDEDGFYYIVGRKNRFIKIFGNRINLDDTERLLKEFIAECACVGRDDEMTIFTTQGNKENDITNYISTTLRINHSAIKVRTVDKIPKNTSGKTIYSQLNIK